MNDPVNKNFLNFDKVELNNYDTNVNNNDLSSNYIIVNDLGACQNIDSLSDDCITYKHGSSRHSRSQTIVSIIVYKTRRI